MYSHYNKEKSFLKYLQVYYNQFIYFLEEKTIIFDFDETLAKVSFDQNTLQNYDEKLDMLSKKGNNIVINILKY